jgi:hypothetical protein
MISKTSERFWRHYYVLPDSVRKEAKKAYQQFKKDPLYPGLRFKRIHSTRPIYSLRITKDYRAVGIQQDNQIIWFWIGSHSEYELILKQF